MTYQRPTIIEIGKAQHLIQGAGSDQTDPDKTSWNIVCGGAGHAACADSGGSSRSSSFLVSMLTLLRMLFG
jgi:hypothetical protein